MKKKGQASLQLGIIISAFIAILVGVIFFQAIAQEAGRSTTTFAINQSLGTISNGTIKYLTDFRALSGVTIFLGLNGSAVNSGNYTVTSNIIDPTSSGLAVSIEPAADEGLEGFEWNITATVQPVTYVAESGGRAVVGLIAIFFALAVAVVALEPTLRSGIMDLVRG